MMMTLKDRKNCRKSFIANILNQLNGKIDNYRQKSQQNAESAISLFVEIQHQRAIFFHITSKFDFVRHLFLALFEENYPFVLKNNLFVLFAEKNTTNYWVISKHFAIKQTMGLLMPGQKKYNQHCLS